MQDWEVNPDKYLKDENGSFIFKKDGTPRLKGGRPKGSKGRGYNYHSQTKAKLETNRVIREKKKKITQTENKLKAYKESLKKNKNTLDKLENPSASKVTTPEELEGVNKHLAEESEKNVIFAPNQGPQGS